MPGNHPQRRPTWVNWILALVPGAGCRILFWFHHLLKLTAMEFSLVTPCFTRPFQKDAHAHLPSVPASLWGEAESWHLCKQDSFPFFKEETLFLGRYNEHIDNQSVKSLHTKQMVPATFSYSRHLTT